VVNLPDVICTEAAANDVAVFPNNGDGTLGAKTTYATGTNPQAVATADVNGDGNLDVVVADQGANAVSVLLGNGDGSLQAKTDFPTGSAPVDAAIADLNGDGKPDLAVVNQSGNSVSVLLGNGLGGFGAKTDFATGSAPAALAIGDVNGDGKPDLVVANALFGNGNTVSVLRGNGDGTFQAKVDLTVGKAPNGVAITDVDGDGIPDIVTANGTYDTVSLLRGTGGGAFDAEVEFGAGNFPSGLAVADLNGDGKPDVVTANSNSNNVSVLLNTGTGAVAVSPGPHNAALRLSAPWPNPARTATQVRFELPRRERVDAAIYDVAGHLVRRLARQDMGAGEHALAWNERDDAGARVGDGVFLIRVRAGGESAVGRVVVAR